MSMIPASLARGLRVLTLAACMVAITAPAPVLSVDEFDDEVEILTAKERWQREYRALLRDANRLRKNAENARYNYSQSRQRNYPRGAAREQFLIDEKEALDELAKVEEEIEVFTRKSRIEGALPGWFYEVEDEPLGPAPQPAAPADDDAAQDRNGRNPLYLDDE